MKHLLLLLLTPLIAHANGELTVLAMLRPPPPTTAPAPPPPPDTLHIAHQRVTVRIADHAAVTHVDQQFTNPLDAVLEGQYTFRLAPQASVSDFAIWDEKTRVPAVIRRREDARAIYDRIVQSQRDPGLLEQTGDNQFSARVFPILPRATKRIELEYRESLRVEEGVACYRYPLTGTPVRDFAITLDLRDSAEVAAAWSPTPGVAVHHHSANHLTVSYEATRPAADLLVYYAIRRPASGVKLMTHRPDPKKPGYWMLSISPVGRDRPGRAKDVVFVVDTSGSMKGDRLAQARRALSYCLEALSAEDRFNVVHFGSEVEALAPGVRPVTTAEIAAAKRWVDALESGGGTNIEGGLAHALRAFPPGGEDRPRYVVFLTDGEPTVGECDPEALQKRARELNTTGARLFVFGIDDAARLPLLAGLAADNRGELLSVHSRDDLSTQLPMFFKRITVPLVENISLAWSGVAPRASHPARLPHFYLGRQLTVVGRYDAPGRGRVTLRARVDGVPITLTADIDFPAHDAGGGQIARVWAVQEARTLPPERAEEIVALSMEHRFPTPLTSFIAVPDAEREQLPESLKDLLDGRRKLVSRTSPDGRVEVEVPEERSVGPVLDELGRLMGVRIEAPAGWSREGRIQLEPMTIDQALDEIARDQGFDVERKTTREGKPVVRLVKQPPPPPDPEGIELVPAGPGPTSGGRPTDFNFKDVELANIYQTIAVLGKFGVIIDPQIARAKMTVSLKQVQPLDALFLISKIQELKVKRVKWEEGSTTVTYAIGRPDKIEKSFEQANSRTVQLKYAKAEDVAGILARGLGRDVNIGVERDPRTNRILLKGTEDVLGRVMDLVKDLDLPLPAPDPNAGVGAVNVGLERADGARAPANVASMDLHFRRLQQVAADLKLRLRLLRLRIGRLSKPGPVIDALRLESAPATGGARVRLALALRPGPGPRPAVSWSARSGTLLEAREDGAVWEAPRFPGVHEIVVQIGAERVVIEIVVFEPGQITYSVEYLQAKIEELTRQVEALIAEQQSLAAQLSR